MTFNIICLILLASMAHQLKLPLVASLSFAFLKAVGLYLLYLNTLELDYVQVFEATFTQFLLSAALGYGIAYLVVKKAQDKRFIAVTLVLSALTFLTENVRLGLLG